MKYWVFVLILFAFSPTVLQASGSADADHGVDHHHIALMMLMVTGMFFVGCCGSLVEKLRQPAVLGQLLAGVACAAAATAFGWAFFQQTMEDVVILFVANLGVMLVLFQAGLEENVTNMLQVGVRAFIVAAVGMIVPGVAGVFLSMTLFPDLQLAAHLFFGATLIATSVGITARIFEDLHYNGKTKTLVIGAAVIDDVGGLIVFSVVSAMLAGTAVSLMMVGGIAGKAALFLVGAIVVGILLAPTLSRLLSFIHSGVNMKMAFALLFCFGFGYLAVELAGLEAIVGAFAAGLLLDHVHFRTFAQPYQYTRLDRWKSMLAPDQSALLQEMERVQHQKEHSHVESLVNGVARFFVPIFFVYTGTLVDLRVFLDPMTVGIALLVALVAILGKLSCSLVAGGNVNRSVVGWAMVARGEVGLVFATFGHAKGVFTDQVFSVLVIVVVITTFLPPMILSRLIRKEQEEVSKAQSS